MHDFFRFVRHLWFVLHFLRGVVLSLLLLLAICAITVAIAEDMPVRTAVYFILITALTIGYGDIALVTPWARLASVAAGLIGVVSTGIVVAAAVLALKRAYRETHGPHDDGDP
jgi:hypothetical protein